MRQLAYGLACTGNSVWLIEADADGLRLTEAASYDVFGHESWRYRLELPQPSGSRIVTVPAEAVVHAQFASQQAAPWRSMAPLEAAGATAELARAIEAA